MSVMAMLRQLTIRCRKSQHVVQGVMMEGKMKLSDGMRKLICSAALLLGTAAVLVTVPRSPHQAANQDSDTMPVVRDGGIGVDEIQMRHGHSAVGEPIGLDSAQASITFLRAR